MTNHERYQRSFSVLYASESCLMEVKAMNNAKRHYAPRLAVISAAVVLVLALAITAYAADVGGIRSNILGWLRSEETDTVLEVQGTEFWINVPGPDGVNRRFHGICEVLDPEANGEFVRDMTEDEVVKYATIALGQQGGKWLTDDGDYREGSMLDMVDPTNGEERYSAGFGYHEDDGLLYCVHILPYQDSDTTD